MMNEAFLNFWEVPWHTTSPMDFDTFQKSLYASDAYVGMADDKLWHAMWLGEFFTMLKLAFARDRVPPCWITALVAPIADDFGFRLETATAFLSCFRWIFFRRIFPFLRQLREAQTSETVKFEKPFATFAEGGWLLNRGFLVNGELMSLRQLLFQVIKNGGANEDEAILELRLAHVVGVNPCPKEGLDPEARFWNFVDIFDQAPIGILSFVDGLRNSGPRRSKACFDVANFWYVFHKANDKDKKLMCLKYASFQILWHAHPLTHTPFTESYFEECSDTSSEEDGSEDETPEADMP